MLRDERMLPSLLYKYTRHTPIGQFEQSISSWLLSRSSCDEHESHLHGESEEVPHAAAPVADDLGDALVADWDGYRDSYKSQDDCKDEGFRQIFLHEIDATVYYLVK